MKRLVHVPLGVLLALCLVDAAEEPATSETGAYAGWEGSWELSEEANRLLGYADDVSRADATWDHPTEFKNLSGQDTRREFGEGKACEYACHLEAPFRA